MHIPVLGMDPSLTHWGLAKGLLDLDTGFLDQLTLQVVETEKSKNKQTRANSQDIARSEKLASVVYPLVKEATIVFVETPVGSQNADAMKSFGICVGIIGMCRSLGAQIIEVQANDVKEALTGNRNATKRMMIDTAVSLYPNANFPRERGKANGRVINDAEHVADAIAAIHAGVLTPEFQNLMRLLAEVNKT